MADREVIAWPESPKDGDVYRWRYTAGVEEGQSLGPFGLYHCKAQKAIVRNGRYIDIFWTDNNLDRAINVGRTELIEYLGNVEDFEKRSFFERDQYDLTDILDMSHGNATKDIRLRKGAKKSYEKTKQSLQKRLDDAHRDLESAARSVERCARDLSLLAATRDPDNYWKAGQ